MQIRVLVLFSGRWAFRMMEDPPEIRKTQPEASENQIKKRVWIKASAEIVYRALTESRELQRWFCDQASCDLREGGELLACWKTGKSLQKGRAVFSRLVPGVSLELLWIDDGTDPESKNSSHTLSYEIRSKSGMTELIMIDKDDSPSDEETRAFFDQGWNSVLLELKDFCERREREAKLRVLSKSGAQKSDAEK